MSTHKTIEERTEEYLGLPLSSRQNHVDWTRTQFQELEAEADRRVEEERERVKNYVKTNEMYLETGEADYVVVKSYDLLEFLTK